MNLRGNYFKNENDGHDSSFMLVLNFNNCSNDKAQQIIDTVIGFADSNFVSDDCYFVSVDTKRGQRFPKKLSVSADGVDISYSVYGMKLPDKKLRKEILEAPLSRPLHNFNEDDFCRYMLDDAYYVSTNNPMDDFSLTFNRTTWDKNGSFECKISVSCYSLAYNYEEITKLYYNLIKETAERFDLFSAYIDFDGFGYGDLLYEYCYDAFLEQEEVFERFRTYPWGGYISRKNIEKCDVIKSTLKSNTFTEEFGDGLFFCSECKPESFNRSKRQKMYNLLSPIMVKSYGVVPIDFIIQSRFKPCEDKVHLVKDCEEVIYVVFSNGISLEEILDNEDDMYSYLKTIEL